MLESLMVNALSFYGVGCEEERGSLKTDCFREFQLEYRKPMSGILQLQAVPNENTLVRFWVFDKELEVLFESFFTYLVQEWAKLGFIDVPDIPKEPIGFRTPVRSDFVNRKRALQKS